MFGIFKSKCPVSEESRQWVQRRFDWAWHTFREKASEQVILPTCDFFPDPYDGGEEAAKRMFDRVCGFLNIDRQRVELRLIEARVDSSRSNLFIKTEGSMAAGTYYQAEGRELITIERSYLQEPMSLVATMAHELCHVHLLGDGRISPDADDHEPLTDLLTVRLGMGIFGANASVRYSAWSGNDRYGWQASSQGYLRQETWGYALGLFAYYRTELRPAWTSHLRPDVRSAVFKSLRYLAQHEPDEK